MISKDAQPPYDDSQDDGHQELEEAQEIEAERTELWAFAKELGLTETDEMVILRKQAQLSESDEEVHDLVSRYYEQAKEMKLAKKDAVTGSKQQMASFLMMALMYHQQYMWPDAEDQMKAAIAYANQMSTQFPEFKAIAKRANQV